MMALQWEAQHFLTTTEISMQAHEHTAISMALHLLKVWEQLFFLKRTHLQSSSKYNGELAFRDTLLKQNNGEISVSVYRKPTHTDQYLHYSSHHQTSCKDSVISSSFNRAYCIITNKDDLHKENARTRQVLKEMMSRDNKSAS